MKIVLFFTYVLDGNIQWNRWCCQMIDYLKGSFVIFELNFKNTTWINIMMKILVCFDWGNSTLVNNLYFQNIVSKHFDKFDLFPKKNNGYCLLILIKRVFAI